MCIASRTFPIAAALAGVTEGCRETHWMCCMSQVHTSFSPLSVRVKFFTLAIAVACLAVSAYIRVGWLNSTIIKHKAVLYYLIESNVNTLMGFLFRWPQSFQITTKYNCYKLVKWSQPFLPCRDSTRNCRVMASFKSWGINLPSLLLESCATKF